MTVWPSARTGRHTSRWNSWPSLRAISDLILICPYDANETAVAWRVAVECGDRPVLLVSSHQNLPTLDHSPYASADGLRRNAYVLRRA